MNCTYARHKAAAANVALNRRPRAGNQGIPASMSPLNITLRCRSRGLVTGILPRDNTGRDCYGRMPSMVFGIKPIAQKSA